MPAVLYRHDLHPVTVALHRLGGEQRPGCEGGAGDLEPGQRGVEVPTQEPSRAAMPGPSGMLAISATTVSISSGRSRSTKSDSTIALTTPAKLVRSASPVARTDSSSCLGYTAR